MIPKQEILEFARVQGVEPRIVEKDYVLGWVLAAINQNKKLDGQWIFKGGTCLKKCYFETYRFSEDLDFTILDVGHINKDFLLQVFAEISEWLAEQIGIDIPVDQIKFDAHPDPAKKYVEGKLYYTGPLQQRGSLAKIILDISNNEILVLPPKECEIYHPYSDKPENGLNARCYSFTEVFAEKTRALAERARPRDLYDIIHLYRNQALLEDKSLLLSTLGKKCEFKSIKTPTLETINNHPFRGELLSEWDNMLKHQLTVLPAIESFLEELPYFFEWLHSENVIEEIEDEGGAVSPAFAAIKNIDTSWTPPLRLMQIAPESSFIEKIRFAAANRLCLDLKYDGTTRLIEPYEVRKTISGEFYLAAIKADSGEHRNYSFGKIQGIKVTDRSFKPRLPIQITSTGQLVIKQNTAKQKLSHSNHYKYIYRCAACSRSFKKGTTNPLLRKHKNKSGYDCTGTYGYYVRTEW